MLGINQYHHQSIRLVKSINMSWMMGMEQPDQILYPTTEIWGSVSIAKKLRTDISNRKDPTIQTTIVHLNQWTELWHSGQNHLPTGSFNSVIYVFRSGRNIDNHTGINPQGPIMTTIPESTRSNHCKIFDSVIKTSDLAYRGFPWNGTTKTGSEKLAENLRCNIRN